ncbi:MAG: M14 family metallopeptidase [Ignavibacteriaceae bacterium]
MKTHLNIFLMLTLAYNCSIAQIDNSWLTKFETSNYLETPRYEETMEYFKRIDENSDYAKMFSFGISPQGRDLNCIVVSKDKTFNPEEAKKTGKPVIFIVNGIHSGEIEGKDACMLLLREILITKEKENLIDNTILVIVPIFSVDAHERFRKYNRINQNGPVEMGWRTTAAGLNLNRDWMKADAVEMQAMLKLFSSWLPDFFVDTHTTDGADYQYTLTYAIETLEDVYRETADFNKNKFIPYLVEKAEKGGYLIAPYVNFKDWRKGFESGLTEGTAPPRFSTIYSALQNRPGLLVETHMMKPYKDRVFSTKLTLETVINFSSENADELVALNKRADVNVVKDYAKDKKYFPLSLTQTEKAETSRFMGKAFIKVPSEISGKDKIVYTDKDTVFDVTVYRENYIKDSVLAPKFYLIPQECSEIIVRMHLHGIKMEQLKNDEEYEVTRYKFLNVKFDEEPYESRQRVNFDIQSYKEKVKVPAGTFKVNTDQRTIGVILQLLEPAGEDSFIRWGFFNTIFHLHEYFEDYVMEKTAEEMLKDDPELKKEFEKKLAEDENFRNDPNARLAYFYERSPYYDDHYRIYPVMRVE